MKALSIRQPWAWAILHAGKDVENRDWFTPFKGRFAIHAAKGMTREEYFDFCEGYGNLVGAGLALDVIVPAFDLLPRGAIVGVAEIVGCVKQSKSAWFQGKYGFVLRDPVVLLEPIPCRGALGFWDVPEDVERQMMIQFGALA